MRITSVSLTALAVALSTLPFSAPAFAQDASAQADSGAPEEIIVTARKRNERLLDVPVAISAMTSEDLARYATNSLSGIAQQTPQLVIAESQNQVGGSINLRGIGAGTSNPSTEQSVTLSLDGVPVSYGNAVRLGQIDLDRVEVLRGPQALFYGKNSPGGIISLISANPGREFEARLRAGYEFQARQRFVEGMVSGPITENISGRLVAYVSDEDGWFRNIGVAVPNLSTGAGAPTLNGHDVFFRGTLAFEAPSGNFRMNLKANYSERSRDGVGPAAYGQLVFCPTGSSQVSGGLTTDCRLDRNFSDVGFPAGATALTSALGDGVPFLRSQQFLGSLTTEIDLSDAVTLTSVTGIFDLAENSLDSFTFVTIPAIGASNDLDTHSFTQELRLATDWDGPLNILVGGFLQDGRFTIGQTVPFRSGANFALFPVTFYDQHTFAYSLFGQARLSVTEQLELSAGARASWENKTLRGTVNRTVFEIANPRQEYDDFSPEVTLTYKPNDDTTLFASYREGFTSGGFNTVPTGLRSPAFPAAALRDLSFNQMTARGGEGGIKAYVLDRQLRFDLVGYYYWYRGLQLSAFDTVSATQTTQNAGSARVRGVEFSATLRPRGLDGFELRSALAYNRSTYGTFIGSCFAGQSVAAGCNLRPRNPSLASSTFGTSANPYTAQSQSGTDLVRAPRWSGNAGFTYDYSVGDTMGLTFSMDAAYTSSYQTQIEAQPQARQKAHWELNGSLSLYSGEDRNWEVSLIGRNLTNELVRIAGGAVAFTGTGTGTTTTTGADLFGSISSPRSLMLQLTLRR